MKRGRRDSEKQKGKEVELGNTEMNLRTEKGEGTIGEKTPTFIQSRHKLYYKWGKYALDIVWILEGTFSHWLLKKSCGWRRRGGKSREERKVFEISALLKPSLGGFKVIWKFIVSSGFYDRTRRLSAFSFHPDPVVLLKGNITLYPSLPTPSVNLNSTSLIQFHISETPLSKLS